MKSWVIYDLVTLCVTLGALWFFKSQTVDRIVITILAVHAITHNMVIATILRRK